MVKKSEVDLLFNKRELKRPRGRPPMVRVEGNPHWTDHRSKTKSVGIRDSLWGEIRNYCDENEMTMVDFIEASARYCMKNKVKVKVTVEVDLGDLKPN